MATSLSQRISDSLSTIDGIGGNSIYADISLLPLSGNSTGDQAFVSATNRLYLWNGAGWFNIALINTSPSITTGPDASYAFAVDGTPIVLTLVAEDPEGISITWSYAVTTGSLGSTATVSQSDNVFTITPSNSEINAGTFGITFTASDGINLATAASSFTLEFTALNNSLEFSVVEEENGTFTKSVAGTASTQSSSVDAALANFKVKEVGGSVITVSQTGNGNGYTPPTLATNNSFAVHSGHISGEQAGMGGYLIRPTLPMEFASLAIYSRSSFTNEQAMADFESGVFG
jgi:hypothetical protein